MTALDQWMRRNGVSNAALGRVVKSAPTTIYRYRTAEMEPEDEMVRRLQWATGLSPRDLAPRRAREAARIFNLVPAEQCMPVPATVAA